MYVYFLLDGCAQLNLTTTISKVLEELKLKINTFIWIEKISRNQHRFYIPIDYVPTLPV
jgi:hypothetical protein